MKTVRCIDCQNFIPDPIGFGDGIGQCAPFNEFLAKNPSVPAINKANQAMGNKLLYPKIERVCVKFLKKGI